MIPESTRLISQSALPLSVVLGAGGLALVTLLVSAYGLRRLPPARRAALLALRALGLSCALVLVLQPALRRERRARVPSRVAVLVDESASMSLPERASDGRSRAAVALDLARAALTETTLRAPDRNIELFALPHDPGKDAQEAPIAVPPAALGDASSPRAASGRSTHLFEAITALPRSVDRDLAAVIVLTDGADHGRLGSGPTGEAELAALRALGAPVHTISIGDPEVRDLLVGRVAHDDFAFVRTPISFEAEVRALGAARAGWVGRNLPVVLRRDGIVVATETLTIGEGDAPAKVSFRHVPERVGKFVFDVSIAPLPGELTARNNIARFPLRVVRDRIRVLQVCGRPSWDERFLRSLFKRDPNVDLISFFILRTPNAIELASINELSLIPFPTDELFRESLHTFDLVVLQNFDYGPYQMGVYLPEIRRYVEAGGALALLGGELSFDAGGYAGTPIEAVLPVELGVAAPAGKGTSALIDPRPVHAALTAAGKTHPLTALALDIDESARLFGQLPALDGVNLVRRARPDATVLAVHPTLLDADHRPMPIISVREAGRGRVLAVGSDSTWRWSFESGQAVGPLGGSRRPYERFWESAIRWLVRDPALSLLRLELARLPGADVMRARVTAVGPDYRPIGGAQVAFSLERIPDPAALEPARSQPLAVLAQPATAATDDAGHLERVLDQLPEGAYRLRARATLGGREAEDEEIFLIEGTQGELADPAPRPALLRALAEATGGEARRADQGVAGLALRPPREVRVAASEDRAIWTSPFSLLVGFGAFALAWWLGRRWGRR